jgi:hypothetical protein
MALTNVLKSFSNGLGEEVREFKSVIRRIRLVSDTSALGANFRKFGASFNTYDFDAFTEKAREFYEDGIESVDPLYTVVHLEGNRVAIDYNCTIRGIYTHKGKPLAFFRPDYHQAGYRSKTAELADFRLGRNVLFS